jgi:hypothetical protein
MKRSELKKILSKWYSDHTIDSIVVGRRKPKYENILDMYLNYKIPFESWNDIKSYLQKNDTKNQQIQPVQKAS